jgi:hypothetical protein
MFNKKLLEEFIVSIILAIAMLVLNWYNFSRGIVNRFYFAGLLIGLFSGQISVCLVELSHLFPNKRATLRSIGGFVLIVITLLFAFISQRLAYAYFLGLGVTASFGYALLALSKGLKKSDP